MKYVFTLVAAASFLASCGNTDTPANQNGTGSLTAAQRQTAATDTANYTSLLWLDSTYQNIGKVKKGQVAEISWRLKNDGNKPLVIAQVSPGCGCTVAERPEEPIMPGGESIIRAKFNSTGQHEGEHVKNLAVTANTKNTQSYQLSFRAEVTN